MAVRRTHQELKARGEPQRDGGICGANGGRIFREGHGKHAYTRAVDSQNRPYSAVMKVGEL